MPMNKGETFCQQCHMKCRVVANVENGRIESIKTQAAQKACMLLRYYIIPTGLSVLWRGWGGGEEFEGGVGLLESLTVPEQKS